jgi:hypothetical protein
MEANMSKPKPTHKLTAQTEEEWEEEVLTEALGDALKLDGDIDFDKLRTRGTTMTLDELAVFD